MSESGFERDGSSTFGGSSYQSSEGGGDSYQPSEGGAAPMLKAQRPRARIQNIVPCCVNQLLTSTLIADVFKIRGIVVSQVSIVGIIRGAEKASNHIRYKIDDMTSKPIEARVWLGREKAKQMTPLPVGVYVKVFGILKGSVETKSLEVLKIHVLEDMNEFTVHILETVNAHMMLEKAQQAATGESASVAPSEMNDPSDNKEDRLDLIRKEVLRLILECPLQEGKSIHELQTQLSGLSVEVIKQAIDYLTFEGHIYPTVDREHFKSAD
ncbi:replication protein A 30 kDa subunit [Carlito syrichta]|uniref:Replication protein A 30 kDa subunit n=1 Tax=Carlito syrichta TaxID=1868482 RepID=A0A1U7U9F0_CARSF|nr:replication protein A 30 kDa subunit [Carlito syrichta]